jgi:dihydroorotase
MPQHNTIILNDPFDAHVHLRQGNMLKHVAPLTAKTFSGALVMPNTNPPIISKEWVEAYRCEVEHAHNDPAFKPYFTLYFQTSYTYQFLESVRDHILAIKFYPKGMTTNSEQGCDPYDTGIDKVLACLEELGIPLCVHGEADGFCLDREFRFGYHYVRWAKQFPRLKIVMEHITDAESVTLLGQYENLHATVTPHHLLLTLDDVIGDKINPHHFCKPIPKREADQHALCELVFGNEDLFANGRNKVMLGTDSAPHWQDDKESASGCAGIFTAPFALQLVAEFVDRCGPERLQAFVSDNAKRIYNLKLPSKTITLIRRPFTIPHQYRDVIPMWAGKTIDWSIA